MANEARDTNRRRSASENRRLRLSEIFDEANPMEKEGESPSKTPRTLNERASELGVKLPPAANSDVIATANRVYDTTPRATVLRVEQPGDANSNAAPAEKDAIAAIGSFLTRPITLRGLSRRAEQESAVENISAVAPEDLSPSQFSSDDFASNTLAPNKTLTWNEEDTESANSATVPAARDGASAPGGHIPGGHTIERTKSMSGTPNVEPALYSEIEQLRGGMEEMYRVMTEMQERGDAQDKVFNTLHSELQDYKNDFIYEHMKPVVRPLLFLFDHMEQFENELAAQRNPAPSQSSERRLLSPELMCENISFFRDQLVEALRICEVTPMKRPEGEVDARLHKVVDTIPTDAAQENKIQRVVRSGWYLNGRVFRPAEVVIGQSR